MADDPFSSVLAQIPPLVAPVAKAVGEAAAPGVAPVVKAAVPAATPLAETAGGAAGKSAADTIGGWGIGTKIAAGAAAVGGVVGLGWLFSMKGRRR